MTTSGQLFLSGKLQDSLDAALVDVKKHPTDTGKRILLCELFCFAGEFERADRQLETIAKQDPQSIPGVSLFRQLLRAETARHQHGREGRVPEFVGEISPLLQLHLAASVAVRDGDFAAAVRLLEQAEAQRPHVVGKCDGAKFEGLRDLDDLTSSFFEVFTSTGKYFWIPIENVELVEFRTPQTPRDLLWRSAHMTVAGGPDGEVYLPVLYANSYTSHDEQLRLGRSSDWVGDEGSPVRGIGQRTFLIGEMDRPILDIRSIEIQRD